MFSASLGDTLIESRWSGEHSDSELEREGLYQVASRKSDGTVYIKIVNESGTEKEVSVSGTAGMPGTVTMLSGERQTVNGYENERVHPETTPFTGTVQMPGYSAAVIELKASP